MKNNLLFLFSLLFVGGEALALNLQDKSLRVGNAANLNPFAICVANQAVHQLLSKTHTYLRLLHSSPDLHSNPPMSATLAFLGQHISETKRNIFQVVLMSLDGQVGWRQVQYSYGEIAPFSALVSDKASVLTSGGSMLGEIDLAECADQ